MPTPRGAVEVIAGLKEYSMKKAFPVEVLFFDVLLYIEAGVDCAKDFCRYRCGY